MPVNTASIWSGGHYSVAVTAKGFRKYMRPAVPLTVNQTQSLDVQLTTGTADESIMSRRKRRNSTSKPQPSSGR